MADAPHTAVLAFEYNPERAAQIARALAPEAGAIEGDRTTATLDHEEEAVTITVAAEDLVALRAGTNTWSTLVEVAERAAKMGNPP